jgi:HAD superfamily hydrolase (TIGR01549 family)
VPISAVTFDFWNTLYHDGGTDRDALIEVRLSALGDALHSCGLEASHDRLLEAHRAGFRAYTAAWQEGRQYGAREQVEFVFAQFGGCSHDGVVERTARIIEESGAQANLRLLPGAAEVVPELAAGGVRLGLISDTSITPGRVLVRFLERDGLLPYFSILTFSDETGFPKPDPRMFRRTLAGLGTPPRDAVHVGDTPRSDIAGALEVGMTAVRFAAVNDLSEPPEPHAVIRDHRELPGLLADL